MDIVEQIEGVKTDSRDCPEVDVVITDCGEILPGEPDGVEVDPKDPYPSRKEKYELQEGETFEEIAATIRQRGNDYFKEKNFKFALKKYKKALRYADKGGEQCKLSWGNA